MKRRVPLRSINSKELGISLWLFLKRIFPTEFYILFLVVFISGCEPPPPSLPTTGTVNITFSNAPYNYSLTIFFKDSSGNYTFSGLNSGGTSFSCSLKPGTYVISASGVEYVSAPIPSNPSYKMPVYHYSTSSATVDVNIGLTTGVTLYIN